MLLETWLEIVTGWKEVFIQRRTVRRAVRQALGSLVCLGRGLVKQHNLSQRFRQMMGQLRQMLDAAGAANKLLVLAADGGFCNRTVFSSPRDRTEIIARAPQDAVLCFRAPQPSRRFYALDKCTPEQVRQEEAIPSLTTKLFYGGKRRPAATAAPVGGGAHPVS